MSISNPYHELIEATKEIKILHEQLAACQKKAIEQWGELAAMTKDRDDLKLDWQKFGEVSSAHAKTLDKLAATEALLAQYRAALEYVLEDDGYVPRASALCKKVVSTALAIPSPQAALNNYVADELERMAGQVHTYDDAEMIRRRAKELREMK